MALSYTEELVSEYYKHVLDDKNKPKYVVSEKVKYKGPKGIGWSDIDVLAIGTDEIRVIETKHYTRKRKGVDMIKKLSKSLDAAKKHVKMQPYSKGKNIKKVFIGTYMSETIVKKLQQKGIETRYLGDIVKDFLRILRRKIYPNWPKKRPWGGRGKEESNVTRSLILLLEEEFIKNKILEE